MAKGEIVAYSSDVSAGVIKSKNKKLCFFKAQWLSKENAPNSGQQVIFDESPGRAENIRPLSSDE